MGATTRATRAATEEKKKALKDITNNEDGKRKEAAPRKASIDVGPSTVPSTAAPVEVGITTRSRSSKKPPAGGEGARGVGIEKESELEDDAGPKEVLEEKFEEAVDPAVSSVNGKKRKASDDLDNNNKRQRRVVTRAAARKIAGEDVETEVTEVVDLTCDERLVTERGLALASGTGSVGAHEEVYPFSVDGGRRLNERKNSLAPYVQNGHLFSIGMRQDLVDWMSQQHGTLDLVDETLHLALRYLDTFLVRRGTEAFLARNGAGSEPVPALPLGPLSDKQVMYLNDGAHVQPLCNKLKRLGITCIFVAAKVTEVSAPSAYDFAVAAEVSTFTRSQLLLAERALLRELDYYLYHPTSSSFSSAYLSAGPSICGSCVSVTLPHLKNEGFVSSTTANDAHSWEDDPCEEITEIVDYLLEASVVSHASLEFAPSAAAAAAIGYTLSRVYDVSWEQLSPLHKLSGYTRDDVAGVFGFFDKLVSDAYDSEEHGRGLHVNDKYQNATSILWRKLFF